MSPSTALLQKKVTVEVGLTFDELQDCPSRRFVEPATEYAWTS